MACFVFLKHPFRDSPFCLITDDTPMKIFSGKTFLTNFPFSRQILISKKNKRQSLPFFNKRFMLGCLGDTYSSFLNDQEKNTIQTCNQHTVFRRQDSNHEDNLWGIYFQDYIKILGTAGPNRDTKTKLSICL